MIKIILLVKIRFGNILTIKLWNLQIYLNLLLNLWGGGKINFPFNHLKEVEINGDNDGESGEGADSSENVIDLIRNSYYTNKNLNNDIWPFNDLSTKEDVEDEYSCTVVKEIGDKSVAEYTIVDINQSNEATVIYCTEYDLNKAKACNDWRYGVVDFCNFPKTGSIVYNAVQGKLKFSSVKRDEWISGFNSIDMIDPDIKDNITFTEIPQNERKSFIEWSSETSQYYFKYNLFSTYCALNNLDVDTVSDKLKEFKQSKSSVIASVDNRNYYLLLFEDTNSALFVPYVENVAMH